MILIRAHSYVTAADGPVICSFTGHSASAISMQIHSYIYSERGLERGSKGSIKGNDW